jgi:hypothetical protein
VPAFTSTAADLVASGPALQIAVGPSRELITALTPLGTHLPSPQSALAIIDTGAHTTVLNPELVHRLRISPVGTAPICTPSTTEPLLCRRYHVNLYLTESFVVENIFAIEAPMGGVPYQCLIGRDVLRLGTLIYEGPVNTFTLTV